MQLSSVLFVVLFSRAMPLKYFIYCFQKNSRDFFVGQKNGLSSADNRPFKIITILFFLHKPHFSHEGRQLNSGSKVHSKQLLPFADQIALMALHLPLDVPEGMVRQYAYYF